jgi:urease accessory protein
MLDRRFALMQLSDSFFPSGSFTLSHGLEALVQTRQVASAQDVEDFIHLLLHNKVGCSDLVALVHAYRASLSNDLLEVRRADDRLFAQTLLQETREAQCKTGQALLMVARSTWADPQLDALHEDIDTNQAHGLHPIVFAMVGRTVGLNESDTVLAFLHNFVTSLVGAAIRLGVLGHLSAQQILSRIAPELIAVAAQAQALSLEAMLSCTPAIDLAQMSHKRLAYKQFVN